MTNLIDVIEQIDVVDTPCNGCTLCCTEVMVPLLDDDPHTKYYEVAGQRLLERKDNGDCVYMFEGGCSAHPYSPKACVAFDCVVAFKAGLETRPDVIERAKELIKQGHDPEVPEVLKRKDLNLRL